MQSLRKRAGVWLAILATGSGPLVLSGCDPTVRDTVLNGVGAAATGLSTTFIQAFVESLMAQAEEDATTL